MTQVVIVAGGLATRMAGTGSGRPKCMLEARGKPFLEHQLKVLMHQGFKNIILCIGHLAGAIMEYFKDGSDHGLQVMYSIEKKPLGTAGAIKLAENMLDDEFVVLYGDVFTDMNFNDLVTFHERNGGRVTINIRENTSLSKKSSLVLMNGKNITTFIEKPSDDAWMKVKNHMTYINNGIYACNKEVLAHVPEGQPFDFGFDLFPRLIQQGENVLGYTAACYFKEIGTPEKYATFTREFHTRTQSWE